MLVNTFSLMSIYEPNCSFLIEPESWIDVTDSDSENLPEMIENSTLNNHHEGSFLFIHFENPT